MKSIPQALENARLRRENRELRATVEELLAAATEGMQAMQMAQRTLQAYADAELVMTAPWGETVRCRLGDLTPTPAVPAERRN